MMKGRNDRHRLNFLLSPVALLLAASGAWAQCTLDTTLGAYQGYQTGDSVLGVVTADVDGDGHLDIVTANFSGYSATILYGAGDGTFGDRQDLPLQPEGSELTATGIEPAVGDLNGDGLNDVVVGVQSPDLGNPGYAVFVNSATGFSEPVFYGFGTQIRGVRLVHMNNDAFLDVVYGNRDDNSINVALGNGDGTFQQETFGTFTGGPTGIVVRDFNNDGVLDVAASLVFSGEVVITVNDGAGNLTETARYTVGSPEGIIAGDFNADGLTDLAVPYTNGSEVQVLLRNADGTYQTPAPISTGADSYPLGITAGDVDGDGFDDIVAARFLNNDVVIIRSNGDGTFTSSLGFAAGPFPRPVAVGDVNGDGALDVVTAGRENGASAVVLLNQCVGSTPVCACELDGDAAQVDVFDLLSYLDLWFANDAAAELTGDEPAAVDVFDLLAFLDCWFPASGGVPCP